MSQREASSKDDAQESRKQFAEDKQTKDVDYWNHVLWSDETKINLFGSDGVKCVWQQPGEEHKDKCVLPTRDELRVRVELMFDSNIVGSTNYERYGPFAPNFE